MFFPSWRYHRTLPPVKVTNPDELAALGPGWADTPAVFASDETVLEPDTDPETDDAPEPAEKPKRGGRRKSAE